MKRNIPIEVLSAGGMSEFDTRGGTLGGPLFLYEDPVTPTEAATRNYVLNRLTSIPASAITEGTFPKQVLPSLAGDVVSQAGSNVLSLTDTGVVVNTYPKLLVNNKGRIVGGSSLSVDDIPSFNWNRITTGKPTTLAGYGVSGALNKNGGTMSGVVINPALPVQSLQAANKAYVDLRVFANSSIGPGDITITGSSVTKNGYLRCNGAALSKTTYFNLYSRVGDTFGLITKTGEQGNINYPKGLPVYTPATTGQGLVDYPNGLPPYFPATPGQGNSAYPNGLLPYVAATPGQGDVNYPSGLLPYVAPDPGQEAIPDHFTGYINASTLNLLAQQISIRLDYVAQRTNNGTGTYTGSYASDFNAPATVSTALTSYGSTAMFAGGSYSAVSGHIGLIYRTYNPAGTGEYLEYTYQGTYNYANRNLGQAYIAPILQQGVVNFPNGLPTYVPPTPQQGDPAYPNGLPAYIAPRPAIGNASFPSGLPIYIPIIPQQGIPAYPNGLPAYLPANVGGGRPWRCQYGMNSSQVADLGSWATGVGLPISLSQSVLAVTKDRVLCIGGYDGANQGSSIYSAPINSDGTLGAWAFLSSFPVTLSNCNGFLVIGNKAFVIGGLMNSATSGNVYVSYIQADGSLGSWSQTQTLPIPLSNAVSFVIGNKIHVIGGNDGVTLSSSIFTANVTETGIDEWVNGTSIPAEVTSSQLVISKNHVYLLGGLTTGGVSSNKIYSASIARDGSLSGWIQSGVLPGPVHKAQSLMTTNRAYLFGGISTNGYLDTIYTAPVNPDGTIGTWSLSASILPTEIASSQLLVTSSKLILMNGQTSTGQINNAYSTDFSGGLNDYSGYYDGSIDVIDPTTFLLPNIDKSANGLYAYIRY